MLLQVIHIRFLWNYVRLRICSNFTNWHCFSKCTRHLYMKWYVIIRFFYNINVLMGSHSVYGIYALLPLSHWVWEQLNCQACIKGQCYMMSHISNPVILSFDLHFCIDWCLHHLCAQLPFVFVRTLPNVLCIF